MKCLQAAGIQVYEVVKVFISFLLPFNPDIHRFLDKGFRNLLYYLSLSYLFDLIWENFQKHNPIYSNCLKLTAICLLLQHEQVYTWAFMWVWTFFLSIFCLKSKFLCYYDFLKFSYFTRMPFLVICRNFLKNSTRLARVNNDA